MGKKRKKNVGKTYSHEASQRGAGAIANQTFGKSRTFSSKKDKERRPERKKKYRKNYFESGDEE